MDSWNGLDFLIFLIFAVNTILGMVRGATKEIISMMCLCASLIVCIRFTVPLAEFFNHSPLIVDVVDSSVIQNFMQAIGAGPVTAGLLKEIFFCISLLMCFVGTFSICEAALSRPSFMEVFSFPYATLNRKVGAALGCTRGYIVVLIFLLVIAHVFRSSNQLGSNIITGSYFCQLFNSSAKKLDDLIISQRPGSYQEIFKDKNLFGSEQVIKYLNSDTSPSAPTPFNPLPGAAPVPVNPLPGAAPAPVPVNPFSGVAPAPVNPYSDTAPASAPDTSPPANTAPTPTPKALPNIYNYSQ